MRRALSILLVALFGFAPFAAALVSSPDPDAGLPACCRRHGAHHCALSAAMAARLAAASSTPILMAPQQCPLCPGLRLAAVAPLHALAAPPVALPGLLAAPRSPQATRAAARASLLRTRSDRGPPSSSSC